MTVKLVITDGIPDQIVDRVNALQKTNSKEEILSAMETLLPVYIKEFENIMSRPAGSGTAAEFQMAASLKRMYLEKTIIHLKQARNP